MKIIIIANNCWNLINFRKKLISQLSKNKNNKLFVIANKDKFSLGLEKLGCQIYDPKIISRGVNIFKELYLFFWFFFIIKKLRPDIVLSYTIKPNIYSSICCKILNIKNICNITGLGSSFNSNILFKSFIINLYKLSVKTSNLVYFQNNSDFNFFKKNNIVKNNSKVIPGSGINLKIKKKINLRKEKKYNFLYVGRIIEDKGIKEMVRAFIKLKKNKIFENVKLTLVGRIEGDLSKEIIKKKITDLKIIKFTSNLENYYLNSDCFLFPSYREGMSKSLLQAGLYKLPIICSNVAGNNELVKNNIHGYLFDSKSEISIYKTMKKVIKSDKKKIRLMTAKLFDKIKLKYDEQIVIKKYLEDIDKMLKN